VRTVGRSRVMAADLERKSVGVVLARSPSTGLAVLMAVRRTKCSHLIRRFPNCAGGVRRSPPPAGRGPAVGRSRSGSSGDVRPGGSHAWLPQGGFVPNANTPFARYWRMLVVQRPPGPRCRRLAESYASSDRWSPVRRRTEHTLCGVRTTGGPAWWPRLPRYTPAATGEKEGP
jgi:hypothetical protein